MPGSASLIFVVALPTAVCCVRSQSIAAALLVYAMAQWKKKHVSRLNDIMTYIQYIYIIIIIIVIIIISALEQLFCRKSSINCIHHSLSNRFGHFLPSGRGMSQSVVRTLGCQKSSQDRLRLKHQPLPELAWHFTLYDSLVSRGLADEWVPVLDGRDTKIQRNTQIIWSYLIYIGGPKRRNT